MKTIDKILKQKPVYLNDWAKSKKFGVIADFEYIFISQDEYKAKVCPYNNVERWIELKSQMKNKIKEWSNINILFASYGCANYEGDAFVLLEKDGNLYEVNAGHCSCFGLEGQFELEATTLEALEYRLINGQLGNSSYAGNEFGNELKSFLGIKK